MRTILILFLCCFLWVGCNESAEVNDDPPKTEQQESIQKQRGWMDAYKIPMLLCGLIVIVVIVLIKIYKLPENEGDDSSCSRSEHKYNGDNVGDKMWIENRINENIEKRLKEEIKHLKEDKVLIKNLAKEVIKECEKTYEVRLKVLGEVKKPEDGDGVKSISTKQEENSNQIRYFGYPKKSGDGDLKFFNDIYDNERRGDVLFKVEIINGKRGKYEPIDVDRLKGHDNVSIAVSYKEGSCDIKDASRFDTIKEEDRGEVHFENKKEAGREEIIWVIDKPVAITLIR